MNKQKWRVLVVLRGYVDVEAANEQEAIEATKQANIEELHFNDDPEFYGKEIIVQGPLCTTKR